MHEVYEEEKKSKEGITLVDSKSQIGINSLIILFLV